MSRWWRLLNNNSQARGNADAASRRRLGLRSAMRARESRPGILAAARVGMCAVPDVPDDLRTRRAGEHPRHAHRGQACAQGAE